LNYDITIIGAGIVGLATAVKLKQKQPGLKVVVVDKEDHISAHQTGHNSGVIHSGLYYKPGSLKADNCLKGYHMLVDFCEQESVPFEICGKVVVATTEEELPLLKNLYDRGIENGLTGLKMLDAAGIKEREPHIRGLKGFFVPQTGIVNYTEVAEKLKEVFIRNNGEIRLNTKVLDFSLKNNTVTTVTSGEEIKSTLVINCAGLYSDKIANLNGTRHDVSIIPFRGEYYQLRKEKQHLIKNLVYPVPDPDFPFLGVHFTRMKKGGVEAGPNAVLAYQREGYKKTDINLKEFREILFWPGFQKVVGKYWRTGMGEFYRSYSKAAFTRALQRLLPELKSSDLISGGSGVRAQACDINGNLLDDFVLDEGANFIHVLNAPSPAATSSLSIGDSLAEMAIKKLS
jgi:L-2-hydroxyglutarate oxidase